MNSLTEQKQNWRFILGILTMCVGMQIANYGTAVCISGEVARMNAAEYYVLISAMGTMGVMLILPVVGRLTAIVGQRNMILLGICIQLGGRICMMFSTGWIPFMLSYLLQSVGGGCYVSSAHANMARATAPQQRSRFFGYIAMANAVGAVFGPILVSNLYAAGGIAAKLAYILNLPVTLLGFALMAKDCPNQKTPGAAKGFDYPGLLLTVTGLSCLVLWMNLGGKLFSWVSFPSAAFLVTAVLSLTGMVRRELRIANPAVPIQMFRNKRLTYAFLCAMVASAYASCSASYSVMWIRLNYMDFPAGSLFTGTAALPQQLVILIVGFFLGGYVGKNFAKRFRIVGVASMAAAMIATGLLFCLPFLGTAAEGDLVVLWGTVPAGMVLIYLATAIGGFTSVAAQSTYSAFWQSNTPADQIPTGQALYTFGSSGGSVVFGAVAGVVLGTSGDYSRVFATGFLFATAGLLAAWIGFRVPAEEK